MIPKHVYFRGTFNAELRVPMHMPVTSGNPQIQRKHLLRKKHIAGKKTKENKLATFT